MGFQEIFHYSILALDIIVGLTLLIVLLIGLLGGYKKMVNKIICLGIPTICLFIFAGPIANRIVTIEVNLQKHEKAIVRVAPEWYGSLSEEEKTQNYSVKYLISKVIVEKLYEGNEAQTENTEEFALALAAGIIKIAVLLFGVIGVFITAAFLRIISAILQKIFKINLRHSNKPLGLLVALPYFVIVFALLFLPVYGSMSFGKMVVDDAMETAESSMSDDMKMNLTIVSEGIEDSFVRKYMLAPVSKLVAPKEMTTLDGVIVGNFLSVKTDNGNLKLYREYKSIRPAVGTILKIYSYYEQHPEAEYIEFSYLSDEDYDNLSTVIADSDILKVLLPVMLEYGGYALEKQGQISQKEFLTKFANIDFGTELKNISKIFTVLKGYKTIKISIKTPKDILTNVQVFQLTKDLMDVIFDSKLITELAIPFAISKGLESLSEQETIKKYNIDFTSIKEIDWSEEGRGLINTILDIYIGYINLEIDVTDIASVLDSEEVPPYVEASFQQISDTTLLTERLLPILTQALAAYAKDNGYDLDLTELQNLDYSEFIKAIGSIVKVALEAYQGLNMKEVGLIGSTEDANFNAYLDDLFDELERSVITEVLIPIAVSFAVDKLKEVEALEKYELDYSHLSEIDWANELEQINQVAEVAAKYVKKIDKDNLQWTDFLDEAYKQDFKDLGEAAASSSVVEQILLPMAVYHLKDLLDSNDNVKEFIGFLGDELTVANLKDMLANDSELVYGIILKAVNVNFESLDSSSLDVIGDLANDVLSLTIVSGHERELVENLINKTGLLDGLTSIGIVLDYDAVTSWPDEVDSLIAIAKDVMSLTNGSLDSFDTDSIFTSLDDPTMQDTIVGLVVEISESKLLKDSLYGLMENLTASFDPSYQIVFTAADKNQIENVNGWEAEARALVELAGSLKDLQATDKDSFDITSIEALLEESSKHVITAKITGCILNNLLSDSASVDFSDPSVLADSIDTIVSAIDLYQNISDNPDLNDTDQVNAILDEIDNLASSSQTQVVVDLINGLTDDSMGYTIDQSDISSSTDILRDAFDQYQASSDQDNFDLDSLDPTTRDQVENNPFASFVFEYLFG